MVLARDVASSRSQVQRWDVMGTITILELDGSSACGQCEQLMPQADTHDRDLRRVHQFPQVIDRLLAMSWVTRAVGDENSIEVMSDLVDRIVEGECCNACTSADETPEDILLDPTVDHSDMCVGAGGADMEGSFRADFSDKIDLFWVDKSFIFIGIILFSDGDPCE